MCACSFAFAVFDDYALWYIPPDVSAIERQLGSDIEGPLGSCENARDVMEMIDVIKSTRF